MRQRNRVLFGCGVVLALSVAVVGCTTGSSDSGGAACKVDGDCADGFICDASHCGKVSCTTVADCLKGGAKDRICIAQAGSADKTCSAKGCKADTDCSDGNKCLNGFCAPKSATGPGTDAVSFGDLTPPTGDTPVTGDTTAAPTPGDCQKCAEDKDCLGGRVCVTIGDAKHCANPCTKEADCGSGYSCFGTDKKACLPGLFQCKDCLVSGCKAGELCNPDSGKCMTQTVTCKGCQSDGECGPGNRCYGNTGGTKACVPECPSNSCPKGGQCKANDKGVNVCAWTFESGCCFGDNCSGPTDPCAACTGAKPKCVNKTCVECAQETDCGANKTCVNNACVDKTTTNCTAPTPHYSAAKNQCCECLNNTNCANGNTCDAATCKCKTTTTGDTCAQCKDPYPGCTQYQNKWVCVQCSEDAHCKDGAKCDKASFTCKGGTGGPIVEGDCQTKGCPDVGATCDQKTGICSSSDGKCNDVTLFCPGGKKCNTGFASIFACFGGGGGGIPTIPGLPAGGSPTDGTCECTADSECTSGLTCKADPIAQLFSIFALLSGQTCNVPKSCQP